MIGILLESLYKHSVASPSPQKAHTPSLQVPNFSCFSSHQTEKQKGINSSHGIQEEAGIRHTAALVQSAKTAFFLQSPLSVTSRRRFMALANRHPV